jgi:hypothetical protein
MVIVLFPYSSFNEAVSMSYCVTLNFKMIISLCLYSPVLGLGRFFSFLILYTVGRTPWTGDQPVARLLPTHSTTQTQNKLTQTSMPQVGLERTIPLVQRAKTVHVLGRAADHCDRL